VAAHLPWRERKLVCLGSRRLAHRQRLRRRRRGQRWRPLGLRTCQERQRGRPANAGDLQWSRFFDSACHGFESLYSIAIDASENVFASGISESSPLNGDFEYSTVKYDSVGAFQWEGRYGGDQGYHYGWIVRPDQSGGAYVTGSTMTTGGEWDAGTPHWNSDGSLGWAPVYRTGYLGDDWGNDIAIDADGNVLVAGQSWEGHGHGDDAWIIKYSPARQMLDLVQYDGPARGDDIWFAIDIDDAGRAVVCGTSIGVGTGTDSIVAKYTAAPAPALAINPDPLRAGQNATLTVTNFEPFSDCYLGYSTQGTGNIYVPFLNVTLGLGNPVQAGTVAVSDASGTAVWQLHIPGNAAGVNVWLQAVPYNEVSGVLATQVQ